MEQIIYKSTKNLQLYKICKKVQIVLKLTENLILYLDTINSTKSIAVAIVRKGPTIGFHSRASVWQISTYSNTLTVPM